MVVREEEGRIIQIMSELEGDVTYEPTVAVECMSIAEGAEMVGVSPATLYGLANKGELPGARRLGKRIVIHSETFMQWLREGVGQ